MFPNNPFGTRLPISSSASRECHARIRRWISADYMTKGQLLNRDLGLLEACSRKTWRTWAPKICTGYPDNGHWHCFTLSRYGRYTGNGDMEKRPFSI